MAGTSFQINTYPTGAEDRQALRNEWLEIHLLRGTRKGLDYGLSMNCSVARRSHRQLDEHGCKNDGSTCLCACHDAR